MLVQLMLVVEMLLEVLLVVVQLLLHVLCWPIESRQGTATARLVISAGTLGGVSKTWNLINSN